MTVTAPMVLPEDVSVVPVADLPQAVREELKPRDDEYAVTRHRSRSATTIVDADGAVLLESFRTPTPIVRAVVAFSRAAGLDPNEVLDRAFPLLQRLLNARILVRADSLEAQEVVASLEPGDRIGDHVVEYALQVVEDVEIYRAEGPRGVVAIKLARLSARSATAALRRERAVLRLLGGALAPCLLDVGELEDRPYLVLGWCDGRDAASAAAQLRRLPAASRAAGLLDLCRSILRAYAGLHSHGVMHGDVHPDNVIIGDSHRVKLIDFGLARVTREDWTGDNPERGGVGFFYEPELARGQREGRPLPPVTERGEQFAVGALLYLLVTGYHYTDFSLDREQVASQIETALPEAFIKRGLEPWPEVERALGRALSKDPMDRFETISDFAAAFEAASVPGWLTDRRLPRSDAPAREVLEEMLERLQPGTKRPLTLRPPIASVNYGAAGAAYALYRLAGIREDAGLLAAADVWAERAARASASDDAFVNEELELGDDVAGRISPYHTLAGVRLVQALVAGARGDIGVQQIAIERFIAVSRQHCGNIDLTLGRSGTMLAAGLLIESLRADTPQLDTTRELLTQLGDATLRGIWDELGDHVVGDSHGPAYLGIAHGWAGILYATIRWCVTTGAHVPSPAADRLEELAERESSDGGAWTTSATDATQVAGWCHGSAGYVFLWSLATEALSCPGYEELALRAAARSISSPEGISSLCCGLAGRGYAALAAYRLTGDRHWLQGATALADAAAAGLAYSPSPQSSLYKGDLGVAMLAADLERPQRAAMPIFEVE